MTDRHGPLPALDARWYSFATSHAAKCPDWPAGCGEYARRPKTSAKSRPGAAVIKHRAGCPVTRSL